MTIHEIPFQEPAMKPIHRRFLGLFGPDADTLPDIPRELQGFVHDWMAPAFHPLVTPRAIRLHYLKSFHPDTGTRFLTTQEKTRVTALAGPIFQGESA